MPKISLIGSGQIGSIIAELCLIDNLGDIILYDVVQGLPQGKALDLRHFSTIFGINRKITGTNAIESIKESDLIIITAGLQRKEGMTREDLMNINGKIIKNIAESVKLYSPNAFVICISNPLDIMVNIFQKYSGLPHEKVCGMAGILDTSRFRTLLADRLNVCPENVNVVILGGHGDLMVTLDRYCSISGIPLSEYVNKNLITQDEIKDIIEKTRDGGAEIIKLCKSSACFAPAAAAVKMIKSYLFNQNHVFPCSVYLNGMYNCSNLYIGCTSKINNKGAFPVEFSLTQHEQNLFEKSVDHVRKNYKKAVELFN